MGNGFIVIFSFVTWFCHAQITTTMTFCSLTPQERRTTEKGNPPCHFSKNQFDKIIVVSLECLRVSHAEKTKVSCFVETNFFFSTLFDFCTVVCGVLSFCLNVESVWGSVNGFCCSSRFYSWRLCIFRNGLILSRHCSFTEHTILKRRKCVVVLSVFSTSKLNITPTSRLQLPRSHSLLKLNLFSNCFHWKQTIKERKGR